ncbi:MAG: hypothetical protein AAFQ91_17385 [Cyanobacteria bacterium J06621_15]
MSVNIVSKNNLKHIKLSIIIIITSIGFIGIHTPTVAEPIQFYNSSLMQIQTQCRKKYNNGSKRGKPKRRKQMGNRLYSVKNY